MTGATWRDELKRALAGATRVAVLGVGQELHRDDGVGMRVARLIAGRPAGSVAGGEGKGRGDRAAAGGGRARGLARWTGLLVRWTGLGGLLRL